MKLKSDLDEQTTIHPKKVLKVFFLDFLVLRSVVYLKTSADPLCADNDGSGMLGELVA